MPLLCFFDQKIERRLDRLDFQREHFCLCVSFLAFWARPNGVFAFFKTVNKCLELVRGSGSGTLEENGSKVPIALDSLIVFSRVTVQSGRTEIYGQIAQVFSENIAPQPAACYATSVPTAFAAPAPVLERISPDFAKYAVEVFVVEASPAAQALVVNYVSPDFAKYVARVCVVKYIAAETEANHAAPVPTVLAVSVLVLEHISPAPAVCNAVTRPKRNARTMSDGTSAWAKLFANSANNEESSSLSSRRLKYSAVIPDGPPAAPLRNFRKLVVHNSKSNTTRAGRT